MKKEIIYVKDNHQVIAYYPKKYFYNKDGEKTFSASVIDFVRGATITEKYVNTNCVVATEEEYKELEQLLIEENVSTTWKD